MPLETSKREAKRSTLFHAALKIMSEKGYNDASVNDITKEAGVSRSVFYYYFESKNDLVEKMLDVGNAYLFNAFNDAVKPGMSTVDTFCTIARVTYEEVYAHPEIARFIFSEVWHHEQEWRAMLGESMNETISVFADLIEQGQAEGMFHSDINVSFASQMVFSVIATTAVACHDGYIKHGGSNIGEQMVEFIHFGLACRDELSAGNAPLPIPQSAKS